MGNGALHRLLRSGDLQAKLTVGPGNDEYEREADRVAEIAMRAPDPGAAAPGTSALSISRFAAAGRQRKCSCGRATGSGGCFECQAPDLLRPQTKLEVSDPGDAHEREADRIALRIAPNAPHAAAPTLIKRLSGKPAGTVGEAPPSIDEAVASPGRPLEPAFRQDMEERFGYDFSRVRLHSGTVAERSARDVHAEAYTVGHHIVLGAGRFAPATREGRQLMAHELTHVVQQSGATPTGGHLSGRAATAGPVVARKRSGASSEALARMSAEEALAVIAEYRGGPSDQSAALAAIQGALQPPFTAENAARRRLLLRAAFSLLDQETAGRVLQVLTTPEGADQKSLRDRFQRLDRSVRGPLLDMLRRPAPTSTSEPSPKAMPSPRASAAWVALGEGVYAYLVGRSGTTLDHVARYVSGHPDLPDLLGKVNELPRNQRLDQLHPVVVPIDYIDTTSRAWKDMPLHIRESIAKERSARASQKGFLRFAQPRSGVRAGFGMFPVTQAILGKPAEALLEASKALLGAFKAVGGFIKGIIAAPYYAAKSIYAFFEGLIDGLRGNLDADTFRRIDDKKPSKLDLVVFVPAYAAGVVKGIYDEGKKLVESVADIIQDPQAFLKSLADLIVAFLTAEGGPVFRALGEAMGKQFADRIKELATESLAGFAFAVGKIAGYVLVEIILTMVGAKAGKFALEAAEKLRGIKRFERLLEKVPRRRRRAGATEAETSLPPKGVDVPEGVLARERDLIRERAARDPSAITPVDDIHAAKGYDFEISVPDPGGRTVTYRRREADGTWCRFASPPFCGHALGPEADRAVASARQARRPSSTGKESEQHVATQLGPQHKPQKRFFEGKKITGTKYGMSITDFFKGGKRRVTVTEVKNIDIAREMRSGFADLNEQVGKYLTNLPDPEKPKYWLFLDVRGQRLTHSLEEIARTVSNRTGYVFDDINFITEIGTVNFKSVILGAGDPLLHAVK